MQPPAPHVADPQRPWLPGPGRDQRILGCVAGGTQRASVARRLDPRQGLLITERDGVVVAIARPSPDDDAPGPDPGPRPAA